MRRFVSPTLSARARYLILAAAAAVLAGTFAYIYLGGLSRRVPVVVAARDFPAFTRLDGEAVKTAYLPEAAVHPSAVTRRDDVLGRVSLVPRQAGEQILGPSLVSGSNPGEFRAGLGGQERALFLPAASVLGGWLGVARGDYLDLTVVLEQGEALCLAQGVEVLEVVNEPGDGSVFARSPAPPVGVLLRATPSQAEQLTLAVECGHVYYSIAGYNAVPVPTQAAWIDGLSEGGGVPEESLWP